LHDVGKIGIPDAILLKPGKHTPEEMQIMRTHVEHGEQIVKGAGWLPSVAAVVAAHHEKWDGQGYPRGLQGDAIPWKPGYLRLWMYLMPCAQSVRTKNRSATSKQ
jgi:HD-GYP domain-containing protein (c-di-GMP phosphodiesterase class II)